jgi:hypothetical protein
MGPEHGQSGRDLPPSRHMALKQAKRNPREDARVKREKLERDRLRQQERPKREPDSTPRDKN